MIHITSTIRSAIVILCALTYLQAISRNCDDMDREIASMQDLSHSSDPIVESHPQQWNHKAATRTFLYVLGLHTKSIDHRGSGDDRGSFLDEMMVSVNSLRRTNTKIPITLMTDDANLPDSFRKLFDNVHYFDPKNVKTGWGDKVEALIQVKFDEIVFLDADTELCTNIDRLFDFMKSFDLASVKAPLYKSNAANGTETPEGKYDGVYHNSGMLVLRKTDHMKDMLLRWQQMHDKSGQRRENQGQGRTFPDQVTLASIVLGDQGIRILQLPINYNFRFHSGVAPILTHGTVYIMHTRKKGEFQTCQAVNNHTSLRLLSPTKGLLYLQPLD